MAKRHTFSFCTSAFALIAAGNLIPAMPLRDECAGAPLMRPARARPPSRRSSCSPSPVSPAEIRTERLTFKRYVRNPHQLVQCLKMDLKAGLREDAYCRDAWVRLFWAAHRQCKPRQQPSKFTGSFTCLLKFSRHEGTATGLQTACQADEQQQRRNHRHPASWLAMPCRQLILSELAVT